MTISIHLDTGDEKVTNLAVANAIIEMCEATRVDILKPRIIAKAILLQVESEDTE